MEERQPQTPWLPPVTPGPAPAPSEERQSSPVSEDRGMLRRIGGGIAALAILLVKLGAKFKALLLLLPKLKLLTTSGTMLVSIAAYSFIWGWKFAVGFVLLLLVHEMGHVIQLRREGIKASAPMFIPFLGAVVSAKSLGGNALAEARVGLAGPVLGTVGAAALVPIADASNSDFLRALAFTGFFLNLFNLLPVVPLDGGRAMAAMAPWMWVVGFLLLIGLAVAYPNPIILLIVLFAAMETWRRWKLRRQGDAETEAYYRVKPLHRALVAAVYIGLVAVLVLGMHHTHLVRTFANA
jgi:Zn-dependent protease